jgi:uncharacterized membrane protein
MKSPAHLLSPTRVRTRWWLATVASSIPIAAVIGGLMQPHLQALVWLVFDPTCHQLGARSFSLNGVQAAVCHRCFGIYAALPLGAMLLPVVASSMRRFHRWTPILILIALTPMGVDWAVDFFTTISNTPVSRLATGAAFGLVSGLLFAHALATSPAHRT